MCSHSLRGTLSKSGSRRVERNLFFIVYGPSGSKIRGFKIGPENAKVDFVTEASAQLCKNWKDFEDF